MFDCGENRGQARDLLEDLMHGEVRDVEARPAGDDAHQQQHHRHRAAHLSLTGRRGVSVNCSTAFGFTLNKTVLNLCILLRSHSFWTVPGAGHGGQQLVVAQGLEVGHILRRGVAEVQC